MSSERTGQRHFVKFAKRDRREENHAKRKLTLERLGVLVLSVYLQPKRI